MKVLNSQFAALLVCAAIALSTFLAKESLWNLGGTYWLVLGLLALVHVIVSGAVFFAHRGSLPISLGALGLLIIGQWWLIQMIAMQIIWRLKGFAP